MASTTEIGSPVLLLQKRVRSVGHQRCTGNGDTESSDNWALTRLLQRYLSCQLGGNCRGKRTDQFKPFKGWLGGAVDHGGCATSSDSNSDIERGKLNLYISNSHLRGPTAWLSPPRGSMFPRGGSNHPQNQAIAMWWWQHPRWQCRESEWVPCSRGASWMLANKQVCSDWEPPRRLLHPVVR